MLAPWTVRNFIVLDKFVPVTTGGGKALFVATYLPGDGRQLRVKRELIRRFEHKRDVTDREVADTQMKDLLDKVARKYPDLRARRGARQDRARELPQVRARGTGRSTRRWS